MDAGERDLFARGVRRAAGAHTGAALDSALAQLGWPEALAGDPRTAVSVLFELQGATNTTSSSVNHVLLGPLGIDGGVVLPALDRWGPPGVLDGRRLSVCGLGTAVLARLPTTVVVARSAASGDVAGRPITLTVPTAALTLRPVGAVDPALGLLEVSVEDWSIEGAPTPAPEWPAAVARAQLAIGHELVGAARSMLDLARDHARHRVQFGRPIAQFQALRHRLAESLVAIETAAALLEEAWREDSPPASAMAKAVSGRTARTVAGHCQQILAGIGFTTEHPFHRYFRRALVLDQLFGSSRRLTRELGNEVLASRQLPPVLPL
ncbi:MAG TPA: acyl-CoA dehydrogenase family protein [Acidimicrobiales bacterium]